MSVPVPLTVCVAILLSTGIMIAVTATGLHRTAFCLIPSLGVLVLIWMAYPPAQTLPPIVSILFWALITYGMYHFPTSPAAPTDDAAASTEDDLLEQFFKETHTS